MPPGNGTAPMPGAFQRALELTGRSVSLEVVTLSAAAPRGPGGRPRAGRPCFGDSDREDVGDPRDETPDDRHDHDRRPQVDDRPSGRRTRSRMTTVEPTSTTSATLAARASATRIRRTRWRPGGSPRRRSRARSTMIMNVADRTAARRPRRRCGTGGPSGWVAARSADPGSRRHDAPTAQSAGSWPHRHHLMGDGSGSPVALLGPGRPGSGDRASSLHRRSVDHAPERRRGPSPALSTWCADAPVDRPEPDRRPAS